MDNSSLMNRENKKGSCGARLFLLCTRMNRKANRRSAMPIKKTVRKRMTIFIIAAVLLGGAAFSIIIMTAIIPSMISGGVGKEPD